MLRILFVTVAAVVLAGGAQSAPNPGIYTSTDLGGAVQTGRGAQSWMAPANAQMGVMDVFNAMSWNGTLGAQWAFSCGIQTGPQVVADHRDGSGTGNVVFTNTFNGGTFWLSKDGPWGDGLNDATGVIDATQLIATVIYVNEIPVQSRLNIDSSGMFDDGCALRFVVANGIGGGDTDLLPVPAGYPAFLDPDCDPTRAFGSWGDVSQITLLIDCPVPVRSSTWGLVKSLYR
jgi:hypothetical protein